MISITHLIKELETKKTRYIFNIGDTISIFLNIKEGSKERVQIFQGICIAKKGKGISETFTVRRTDFKGKIERIFPFFTPSIKNIVVKQSRNVKRAKLYYLRDPFRKKSKIKRSLNKNASKK